MPQIGINVTVNAFVVEVMNVEFRVNDNNETEQTGIITTDYVRLEHVDFKKVQDNNNGTRTLAMTYFHEGELKTVTFQDQYNYLQNVQNSIAGITDFDAIEDYVRRDFYSFRVTG
jgi:hypothetical protein